MAKKESAELLLKIKSTGARTIDSIKSAFSKMKFGILAGAAAVGAAVFALKKSFDFSVEASKFQDVKRAFNSMAAAQGEDADQMIKKMRSLSENTVSDLELMQQANQALMLGLPVDRFGDMLTIARSAAKSTGQSMQFMLQSIVTGLGRGSKLMLDNLGIVFKIEDAYAEYAETLNKTANDLTEAEKKQAFINKALEVGEQNAKNAGAGQLSLADKSQQLQTKFENLSLSLKERLIPAMSDLADLGLKALGVFDKFNTSADLASKPVEFLDLEIQRLNQRLLELGKFELNIGGEAKREVDEIVLKLNELVAARAVVQSKMDEIRAAQDLKEEEQRITEKEKQREHELELLDIKSQSLLTEASIRNSSGIAKISAQLKENAILLKNEKDFAKKKALLQQKFLLTQQLVQGESDKRRENDQRMAFSRIATLQSSHNKALAFAGKAAAITQIAIDTPVAIVKTLAAFPFPFNIAAAGLVGAAAAVQAGRIAGVQLESGGIVSARQGGTPAILGEGGRDEAVVPLDDTGGVAGLGTNITINVNGGLLGDESSARELAVAVDQQLLLLRQDNSSVAFDTDVI